MAAAQQPTATPSASDTHRTHASGSTAPLGDQRDSDASLEVRRTGVGAPNQYRHCAIETILRSRANAILPSPPSAQEVAEAKKQFSAGMKLKSAGQDRGCLREV